MRAHSNNKSCGFLILETGYMHHQCLTCSRVTLFERTHRTFLGRLKTLQSTLRPHDCSECHTPKIIDVHYRSSRDIQFEVAVILGGLVFLIAFAALLVASQK